MNGAAGTTGQVLTSAGAGSLPTWSNAGTSGTSGSSGVNGSSSYVNVSNTCGGTTYAGSNGISVSGNDGTSGITPCGKFIANGNQGWTGQVMIAGGGTRNVINGIIV